MAKNKAKKASANFETFSYYDDMMSKLKEPKPKSLKEVPGYLGRLITKTAKRLFYIFKLVWETRRWIFFVMLFMAIYNGIRPVVAALILANLLNSVANGIIHQTMDGIYVALIAQFAYLLINSVVNNLYSILTRIGAERVTNHIKVKIMTKSKEVDLASFDRPEFYERLENANREASSRPISILDNSLSIISQIIAIVSFIVISAQVLPYAPVVIILTSIPTAIVNFKYKRKNYNYIRWRSIDRRQMNYYSDIMVNKDMAKEIRLFGLADHFIGGFKRVFGNYFNGIKKLIYREGIWGVVLTLITTGVNCLLYIAIANKIINGSGEVGDFSLYTGALDSINASVSAIISTTASIYEGTLFIDNLINFMNEKRTIVPVNAKEPAILNRHCGHTIKFEHVYFRYPGAKQDVLHDVNFELEAGDTCVLVGLNGAGKTTLIKLLTRLYDPTSGTIYLDGRDIREYNVEELYDMYGIIFQDFGKYAFSVADNISFGEINREVDMADVKDAAERSAAAQFIDKLPDKYDTPLMRYFSRDGIELSIGQWQKLSVARAFYSDSDFLILDEPTASLDAIAEQEIFKEFDELRKDKTTIFVSHRLSSATVATKIIVLENGRIVEEGNHQELMNARGKYYELFSTQAKRYITTADEGLIGEEELIDVVPEQSGMSAGHHRPADRKRAQNNAVSDKESEAQNSQLQMSENVR